MSVGTIGARVVKGIAIAAMAVTSATGVCDLLDRKRKREKELRAEGYAEAEKHFKDELDYLRKRNQELLEEAIKRSRAAE